ncbi:phosphoribosylglycinamide formyltransferase [Temperatibacter marinus]|uniref:Phosphoribosylglycinamide formyltransferase n=1 Tax=Temperatibacter marinus TaxID=1456591 RepID=A0AA52ECH3_9PROT|nr:phosphoribosylglycinamide formyltransferase [Temperatibacter marinus]WND02175.1 phosphoribosylglycinamide formyltransferase [Temperatibacter marinus]
MSNLKLGVMISGRGSNLQALIDACADPGFPAEIVVVISNKADAYGLERARMAGIKAVSFSQKKHSSKEAYEQSIDAELRDMGVELVCLAGYMRILGSDFVKGWIDHMINIHPSLLPAYKGLNTHKRALEDGCRFTGCTVHYVVPDLDSGPIISQAAIPISMDDTNETLADKVLPYEHKLYPYAVKLIAEKRINLINNVVHIKGYEDPINGVINPAV